jgi:hypothetical protein
MPNIKKTDKGKVIDKSMFESCLIDGLSLKEICKKYTRNDLNKKVTYALDKFIFHLKKVHSISVKDYCIKYLHYDWPKCPIKMDDVGYVVAGYGLCLSRYNQGAVSPDFMPGLKASYERMAIERKGSGNPMYNKDAWNKGLTTETSDILRIRGLAQRGRITPPETILKQKEARLRHPLKIRHNKPHSKETKEKLRVSTANLWARGVFNRVTSIHIKMREFLLTLPLNSVLKEEFPVKYFAMDFAFPERKIAIECQGTFFHIDPRVYPNGPITAIQRRNFGRDIAKRKVCGEQEGWTIIEAWEIEINDGSFKEQIKCKLKELNLLDESVNEIQSILPLTVPITTSMPKE